MADAAKKPTAPKKDAPQEKKAAAPAPQEGAAPKGPSSVTLKDGRGGILGVKAGMTQVYNKDGEVAAVTVIQLRPNVVTQVKDQKTHGYQAVQVGFLDKKPKKVSKPEKGHVKKQKNAFQIYHEFRLPEGSSTDGFTVGSTLSADFIKEGDLVDLTATSKGKGFQGVMKKYNFSGGPASHGASIVHRMPGSIGQRATPGRVFKGKKMAGQMGNKKVTIQNVRVVKVDPANSMILVDGSVPGPKSSVVTIRRAVKGLGA